MGGCYETFKISPSMFLRLRHAAVADGGFIHDCGHFNRSDSAAVTKSAASSPIQGMLAKGGTLCHTKHGVGKTARS